MAWRTQARLSQSCLRAVWIALLLVCYFAVCQSERAGRSKRNANNVFTEPGIIIGIIVGVLGVLVVLGVSLLLCRLFCCKNQSCCACCGERDVYQEAGTAPIKIASESSTPDHRPDPTSQPRDRPTRFKPRKTESASPPTPPQYDDLSRPSPDFADSRHMSKQNLEKDRRPDLLPLASDDDTSVITAGAKLRHAEDATTQGLQNENCELDNPDFHPNERGFRSQSDFEAKKKRHHEKTRRGKEFPHSGHKLRKRSLKRSQEDDQGPVSESRSNEAREFPLLEIEPRKHNISPAHSNSMHESWEDNLLPSADTQELMPATNRNQRLHADRQYSSERQEFTPEANRGQMLQTDMQYSPNRQEFTPQVNISQRLQTDMQFSSNRHEFTPEENINHRFHADTGYSPDRQDFTLSANWDQRFHTDMPYSLNREEFMPAPDRSRTWDNERRPAKHMSTDTPPPRHQPSLDSSSARHGTVQVNMGRINHSFNPDSTETTV